MAHTKSRRFLLVFSLLISFILCLYPNRHRRLSPSQQISSINDSTVESSSLSLSQTNLSACGPSTRHESWTCALCTYFNQTKSSRCAQCATKRDAIAEPSSHATNYVQEQIDALSIRDATDSEVNAATVNRTSPLGSSNLSGSRTNLGAVGTRNSPVGEQQNKNQPAMTKWCCVVMTKMTMRMGGGWWDNKMFNTVCFRFCSQTCTFVNWPRSLRCSMCGCPKETVNNNETERFGANTLSSPERDIDENCAGNFIISNSNKRNLSHHRYQLSGSGESINNCDSLQERRIRQIRRQVDWQWLNACIGEFTIIFTPSNRPLIWNRIFFFFFLQVLSRIITQPLKRICRVAVIRDDR